MGDTVKCAFCGVLEDWEDFHVWGCEVCDKVFCDDCAPAGSDPMNPRKLILCPECAAKQQGVDLGCWLCAHGQDAREAEPEDCVSCMRCIGRDITDMEGFSDNFEPALLALPA